MGNPSDRPARAIPLPTRGSAKDEAAFRSAGVPFTAQRRAVLEVLRERGDHPTADALYEAVSSRLPGTSRTTVYRSLEALVELGLAVRVCHPGSAARYDGKTRRHQHLICERCGLVQDVEEPSLENLPLSLAAARDFQVRTHAVQLLGLCGACSQPAPPSPQPSP